MEQELTSRQKELVSRAKEKGHITKEDINAIWSSHMARSSNMERLIALGIFELDEENKRYKYKK